MKWPPWSLEDLLINKGRKSKHFTAWQHQTWRSESMVTVTSACLLTPWDDVIRVHFGVNVVNFHNEEVEINSLDQHPTESGHQEILHQSCYCNTGSLWKERVFVYFLTCSFRQDIYGAKSKLILQTEGEATDFVFCGVYSGEEDDLSSSKGHRNTQSNLRERFTNISGKIILKTRRMNETKATTHRKKWQKIN